VAPAALNVACDAEHTVAAAGVMVNSGKLYVASATVRLLTQPSEFVAATE